MDTTNSFRAGYSSWNPMASSTWSAYSSCRRTMAGTRPTELAFTRWISRDGDGAACVILAAALSFCPSSTSAHHVPLPASVGCCRTGCTSCSIAATPCKSPCLWSGFAGFWLKPNPNREGVTGRFKNQRVDSFHGLLLSVALSSWGRLESDDGVHEEVAHGDIMGLACCEQGATAVGKHYTASSLLIIASSLTPHHC